MIILRNALRKAGKNFCCCCDFRSKCTDLPLLFLCLFQVVHDALEHGNDLVRQIRSSCTMKPMCIHIDAHEAKGSEKGEGLEAVSPEGALPVFFSRAFSLRSASAALASKASMSMAVIGLLLHTLRLDHLHVGLARHGQFSYTLKSKTHFMMMASICLRQSSWSDV